MVIDNPDVELLVELAMEVGTADPIDWGMLNYKEEDAYRLMAMHVLERLKGEPEIVLLSTITKLIVENFCTQLKLEEVVRLKNQKW
jgi:hypothetical protein